MKSNQSPTSTATLPPSAIWAALLSLACAGLGQVYAGFFVRGIALFFGTMLFVPTTLALVALEPSRLLLLLWLASVLVVLLLRVFAVIDAARVARHATSSNRAGPVPSFALLVLFGVVGISQSLASPWLIRSNLTAAYLMVENSMAPNLVDGDRILVNRWAVGDGSEVLRGDVVAFRRPEQRGQVYVKRVIGLPGDSVTLNEGRILINGKELERTPERSDSSPANPPLDRSVRTHRERAGDRSYVVLDPDSEPSSGSNGAGRRPSQTFEVPRDSVFVLGDHRDRSLDSRSFGAVPLGDIIGNVQYVFAPAASWRRFGPL